MSPTWLMVSIVVGILRAAFIIFMVYLGLDTYQTQQKISDLDNQLKEAQWLSTFREMRAAERQLSTLDPLSPEANNLKKKIDSLNKTLEGIDVLP